MVSHERYLTTSTPTKDATIICSIAQLSSFRPCKYCQMETLDNKEIMRFHFNRYNNNKISIFKVLGGCPLVVNKKLFIPFTYSLKKFLAAQITSIWKNLDDCVNSLFQVHSKTWGALWATL